MNYATALMTSHYNASTARFDLTEGETKVMTLAAREAWLLEREEHRTLQSD
jgi:hypothetical protein